MSGAGRAQPRERGALRRRLRQLAVATAAVAVAVAVVEVVVKSSDGAFAGTYRLTGSFAEAGHGLEPGSEVAYRGVQVGRVTSIELRAGRADVVLAMDPSFRVPSDALATIEPVNVFGADEVALTFPARGRGRLLAAGGSLAHTAVDRGLEGLFAAAAPLLRQVDTTDLSTVVQNLAAASAGEGPTLRASVDEGAKLAAFLDQTLPAQLAALDSLDGFTGALVPAAGSIDAIGRSANRLLPELNANAPAYRALLADLTPFATNLAQFLSAYHPDIQTLLANGDDVARLVLARQQDIGSLVAGLAVYEAKIAGAVDPAETLPNGSAFGYFDAFVSLGNLNQLVCSLLDPQLPGLSFLAPLQQALAGAGTPLHCASSASGGQASPTSPSVAASAQNLSTSLYGQLGEPSSPGGSRAGAGTARSGAGAGAAPGTAGGTGAAPGAGGSAGGDGSAATGPVPGAGGATSSSTTNVLGQLLGGLL